MGHLEIKNGNKSASVAIKGNAQFIDFVYIFC